MIICVCGGGNLGHVVTGFLAAEGGNEVRLLTRRPQQWCNQITIDTPDGKQLVGNVALITDDAKAATADADIILLCVPGFSIHDELCRIRPYVTPKSCVGSIVSSTGFFFEAMKLLPEEVTLFGFQRVPFIARTTVYGHSAQLLGYKPSLNVAIEHGEDKERLRKVLQQLFHTPVNLLGSYYEASLTNSNPLLHPSRLFTLWHDWHQGIVYENQCQFYSDWTDEASDVYIGLDREFQHLLSLLPVTPGSIPTVLDYYESHDSPSLTRKLRSIEAFKGILAPMKQVEGGFVPDFGSRYFKEDFPFGLDIVRRLAVEKHLSTPIIDDVCQWGRAVMS
jgi:opine dehydrogenase